MAQVLAPTGEAPTRRAREAAPTSSAVEAASALPMPARRAATAPASLTTAPTSSPPHPRTSPEQTPQVATGEMAKQGERPVVVVPADSEAGSPRPLFVGEQRGPRIVIEHVHVNTYGTDGTVEVRLAIGDRTASGVASGPAVAGFLLRLCATATAGAVDELLASSEHPDGPARCFVEHAAAVPFGNAQVAVVVLLLSCNGWVEQLSGSAVVISDDRHAMVRATLAAVNRRFEALLSR